MDDRKLHEIHTDSADYISVLRWLANGGLISHLQAHLHDLPANHPWWDCVIGEFGESTLIGLGVDL